MTYINKNTKKMKIMKSEKKKIRDDKSDKK